MVSDGPAKAISVCKEEASEIARKVGEKHDLKIGRSGIRLRNPNNQAPEWARRCITEKADAPKFVRLTSGEAAALLPIKLKVQCLMCHGPDEQIASVIKDQLARLYPRDKATGFKEGELRGWFWIEKPAS
ncbi:MAG: DUF3365 domain-containing protein [Planctomycetota bacterium]